MGLVTLGPDRRIDACFGSLVGWLPTGSQASDAIPVLTGLDDVLDEIGKGLRPSFSLPRVTIAKGPLTDKVLSLEIMPSASLNELQILIRDETRLASLEQKVLQQRNELALANQELAEAKRQAEAALREKSAFLANISHDLKTPLQVIMGNAEILRGDLSEAERDGFLQDVLDNSDFLLALITDLLDASALEAEQLKLNEEPVDIQSLLERIVSMAQRMPGGDKRCFDLSVDDHHRWILADPMRLQRILLNVIGNAVKFTNERGRISVSAGLVDTGELVIEIEDDGCGIDANLMERVFEPFMRGNTGNGSGLGLHIARGLADLHEAELVLASKAGIGTKASLRLPSSRIVNAPR